MKKTKKNNHRLIIQIVCIMIPFLIIMISAAIFSMYRGSVNGYREAQKDHMGEFLDDQIALRFFKYAEFFDYWEKHPELLDEDLSQIGGYIPNSYFMNHSLDEMAEWLRVQPEESKKTMAHYSYEMMKSILEYDMTGKDFESIFIIDISPPNAGYVFYMHDYSNSKQKYKFGDKIDFDLSDHAVLEQVLENKNSKVVYEQTENFIAEGSQYIGYKPIIINNEVRAVIGVSYDWSELRSSLIMSVMNTFVLGVLGITAAMILLFVLIRSKVVSPVRKIQNGLRDYIETKDSSQIQSEMSKIKTKNEFGILSQDISDMAVAIDSYTNDIVALTGERERVAAELDMARNIQVSQLPSTFPAFPERTEFDIYATMTPAKEVGGDFYDFFTVDDDHLAMVMADVSGKGVPAALFMMISKMLINNFASMGYEPAEVLTRTNEMLCRNNKGRMFVTVWLGILEISTGKVTAANAGHEYPMLRQPNGKFELFNDPHGFVIGGFKNKKYTQYEFEMKKGSSLFVFTDGVTEARNAERKMFGADRILDALNKDPDAMPKALLEKVHDEVNAFVGDAPQFDDLTMLGIKILD